MKQPNSKHIDSALVGQHNTPMYLMHKFWARKSHNIVSQYISTYSKEREIVLDPFLGSGVTAIEAVKLGRRAVGIDVNPLMIFIAQMTSCLVDIELLKKEFERVSKETSEKILKYYVTKCTTCKNEASIIGTKWDLGKQQPLLIRFECPICKKRRNKKLDSDDLKKIKDTNEEKVPFWFPRDKLQYPSGKEFKEGTHLEKIQDVPSLFTHRNLICLSILYNSIEKTKDETTRNLLKFAFTSSLAQTSKLCEDRPTRPYSSAWITHRYWIPSKYMEFNVWQVYGSHVKGKEGVIRGKEFSQKQIAGKGFWKEAKNFKDLSEEDSKKTILLKPISALDISKEIPDNSVDYCFTDPPYGSSIQYYELSKMWASWLKIETDSKEEVIVNGQQGKDEKYYFGLMRRAFDEVYRVLKPECYLTVTFNNTKISIFNMIVRATEYAGFELEKIVYQKSSRTGAKALGQPYGSAIGDYYLRFKKLSTKKQLKEVDVSDEQYKRVVIDSVKKIIGERGQATPYTFILNGVYPILNSYGYLLTDSGDIKKIMESELGKEFVLKDVSEGLISGKAWWFKDPNKSVAYIESTPLNERVEKAVLQMLSTHAKVSFDDVLHFIFTKFPNSLTPDRDDVMAILKEYAEKTKDGKWIIKASIDQRKSQHDGMVERLCLLGEKAGFEVYADIPDRRLKLSLDGIVGRERERVQEIDVLWYKNSKIHYEFEIENSTIITEAIIRGSNIPYQVKRFIVIPDEREAFLSKKIEEPALKERIKSDNWGFIRYDDLKKFDNQKERARTINLEEFEFLNRAPKRSSDSSMDDFTREDSV